MSDSANTQLDCFNCGGTGFTTLCRFVETVIDALKDGVVFDLDAGGAFQAPCPYCNTTLYMRDFPRRWGFL